VAAAPPAPPPVVVDAPPRIYSAGDANVVPPITIRQVVPPYPGKVLIAGASTMEVVIDTAGNVESAVMDVPLHPVYDRIALGAARTWQYQPATVDGKAVKFRKRIQLSLVTTTAQ
jgi:TonB family protein